MLVIEHQFYLFPFRPAYFELVLFKITALFIIQTNLDSSLILDTLKYFFIKKKKGISSQLANICKKRRFETAR